AGGRRRALEARDAEVGAHALQAALEPAEFAARELERHVAQRRAALRRLELDAHAIERLEIPRAAGAGERRVAVREHAGELDAGRERAADREVEALAQERVLSGAELDRDRLVTRQVERSTRCRFGRVALHSGPAPDRGGRTGVD